MQRVGEFEKVSFEQFRDAMKDEFYRGQELPPAIEDDLRKMWEKFHSPAEQRLAPPVMTLRHHLHLRCAPAKQ